MISLTKMGRIITIIMTVLTVMIATLAGIIYLIPNRHSLYIMNRSSGDVVITQTLLNGKPMGANNVLLKPKKQKEQGSDIGKKLELRFKASGNSVLNLDVKFRGEKETRLSCNLEDPNRVGCIFYANIRNEDELACFCDSYADSY
ncbi:hypothetical protein LIN78_05275 [Leeia sp. TBRC 13508]|uniref:Uncharacterized protein n=1 Tax=Leeia speluncae TaxID=2884804 RepID=A0ABS8D5Q7_9NEIS|nr:hypothetical protein [Leeia speluncae]MCB6182958.1 hypothetical protein [Leeia speluncae]